MQRSPAGPKPAATAASAAASRSASADQHVILAPPEGLHSFAVLGCAPVNLPGHRGGADRAHRSYIGVVEQVITVVASP